MTNEYSTVKELANDLNVTVQTVYNYLNQIDKVKHTKKINNKLSIDEKGVQLIKDLYFKNNPESENQNTDSETTMKYIETLEKQLDVKDRQIFELTERIKEQNLIIYSYKELNGQMIEYKQDEIEEDIQDPEKAVKEEIGILERIKSLFR